MARPPFELGDFFGGYESFGEAGSEYHLSRGSPDARRWCWRLVGYFGLSGLRCRFQG